MHLVYRWFNSVFDDIQLLTLLAVLTIVGGIVLLAGDLLAPVIASIIIAFLLESPIRALEKLRWPRLVSVCVVFGGFMLFLTVLILGLIPLLISQITELVNNIPWILSRAETAILSLPQKIPLLSEAHIETIMDSLAAQFSLYGQQMITFTLSSVRSVFSFVLYLVLMPVLVFFFLKDKKKIFAWMQDFLPQDHALATRVWLDVQAQTGNYVRGRIWEILLVWVATYACFFFFGLDYGILLSLLVGVSVIIPYIGAVIATVPVIIIAYLQWGVDGHFTGTMISYGVVQLLDANVLIPLLLAGTVNVHPIASITAILFFGGVWGFWGVFFAIPLATLTQAVIRAWRCRRQNLRPGSLSVTENCDAYALQGNPNDTL